MEFTEQEEKTLRCHTLTIDIQDGKGGTFTTSDIAKLKDMIAAWDLQRGPFCKSCVVCGSDIPDSGPDACPHHAPRWMPPTMQPLPAWQPSDVSVVPPPIPGQGAKL